MLKKYHLPIIAILHTISPENTTQKAVQAHK